jgi:hypothetical protein
MTPHRAACLLLLTLQAGLAILSLRQHNLTVDEGGHLFSGLLAWEEGRLDVYPVNPPLVKALAALPIVISRPRLSESVRWSASMDWVPEHNRFVHKNRDQYQELIFRARYMLVAFSVLGGWLVYRWSSQLFGQTAGLVALSLWAFCPNVLCWAGVCTVDLGATVFGLAAVYALRCYLHQPAWLGAAWSGCVLGLALLSKFTLLVLYPVFLVICLLACWQPGDGRISGRTMKRCLHFALLLLISLLAVNMGYGFQGTGRALGTFSFRCQALADLAQSSWLHGTWAKHVPVPLPEGYILGLDQQKYQAELYSPSYLHGQWRKGGWWYYYLYALGVKLPLGTLILCGLTAWLVCTQGCYRARGLDEWLIWLPAGAILMLISSQMRDQFASIRYVLPMFPFLFIGISRVGLILEQTWKLCSGRARLLPSRSPKWLGRVGRRTRLALANWSFCVSAGVIMALAWNALSLVRIHPHYLSYFNEIAGGPDHGWQHLLESNIDWGQDLLFLKRWVDLHPEVQPLGLAYYGGIDPHLVGLKYRLPSYGGNAESPAPKPGWYAVSVNFVCGARFRGYDERGQDISFPAGAFSYFQQFTPVDKAGYSIFIYHITPEEANQVRAKRAPRPVEES